MKQTIFEESFTNEFGTFNPGDRCYIVTAGYSGAINIREGFYHGYTLVTPLYGHQLEKRLKVSYTHKVMKYRNKSTGEIISAQSYYKLRLYDQYGRESVEEEYTSTLQLNRILPHK